MASITERQGKYRARVRRDGYPTACKTFTLKKDAQAWARQVEAAMDAGRWEAPSSTMTAAAAPTAPTVGEALKLYRAKVAASFKGAAVYAYWFDEIAAWTSASKPVDQITAVDVASWRDEQGLKLAPGTVARKLGLLSGFFSWCHKERGWIASNPVHSVRKPLVRDARSRVLSNEERAYLLTAAKASRCRWLADGLTVLLHSAMRRGELCSLGVKDVDFGAAVAHLSDTKNGDARDVPLCPNSLAALRSLVHQAQGRGDERLIPVSDPHAVSVAFRRVVAKAQANYRSDCAREGQQADEGFLSDFRLHDARHTAVTTWASTGALSVLELQRVSGHRTLSMLSRYTNLKATDIASKLAKVSGHM